MYANIAISISIRINLCCILRVFACVDSANPVAHLLFERGSCVSVCVYILLQ